MDHRRDPQPRLLDEVALDLVPQFRHPLRPRPRLNGDPADLADAVCGREARGDPTRARRRRAVPRTTCSRAARTSPPSVMRVMSSSMSVTKLPLRLGRASAQSICRPHGRPPALRVDGNRLPIQPADSGTTGAERVSGNVLAPTPQRISSGRAVTRAIERANGERRGFRLVGDMFAGGSRPCGPRSGQPTGTR